MDLKIKKMNKKVELDTKVEGCLSDCHSGTYIWLGYNAEVYRELGTCRKIEKMTAKSCLFW